MNVCAEGKLSSKGNRLNWGTVPAANLNSLFELDGQRKRPAARLRRLLQEWNVEHETLL